MSITALLAPIEIGLTDGSCTRSAASTTRSAADTPRSTLKLALPRGLAPRAFSFAGRRASSLTPWERTGIRGRTCTGYNRLEGPGARAALHSRTNDGHWSRNCADTSWASARRADSLHHPVVDKMLLPRGNAPQSPTYRAGALAFELRKDSASNEAHLNLILPAIWKWWRTAGNAPA